MIDRFVGLPGDGGISLFSCFLLYSILLKYRSVESCLLYPDCFGGVDLW